MYSKRQQYPDFTTLFQYLTSEVSSLPCLNNKTGLVRTFNVLPSDVKFNVYIDNILLGKELEYKQFSYYIAVSALKSHNVKVFRSDNLNTPIIDTQVQIHPANVETLAIVGSVENPSILMITGESEQPIYSDKSLIRYANLADRNITVNVLSSNKIVSSKNINHNEYNRYEIITPGTYQFEFILTDATANTFQTSSIHELNFTRIYTFYLVGSLDINSIYPLELVISVDIISVIKKCPDIMKSF